jgi:cytochrome c-type protein NapC
MSQTDSNNNNTGNKLWRRTRYWFLLGIPVGGFLMFAAGIIFWGGFNATLEASSSTWFCSSACHEMNTVAEEYKQSVHYLNASGVSASCADCHIPKPFVAKMMRKTQAGINDVYHKMLGTIDTPEKYEARRLELAEGVWKRMKETDSRECRNCHSLDNMSLDKQDKSARKKHNRERMLERGETCIDCHKGISHKLPEDYEG